MIYPSQGGNGAQRGVPDRWRTSRARCCDGCRRTRWSAGPPTSITQRFKRKTVELRDTWINNQQAMRTRADALLAQLGVAETRVEFDWIVDDYADFTALDISDLIRLKLPSYTSDAYIENLALRIPLSPGSCPSAPSRPPSHPVWRPHLRHRHRRPQETASRCP